MYLQTLHFSEIHFVQHSTRQSTDFRFILLQNLLAKVVSFGLEYVMKSNTNLSEREFGKVRFYSTLSQARNLSRYALCPTPLTTYRLNEALFLLKLTVFTSYAVRFLTGTDLN